METPREFGGGISSTEPLEKDYLFTGVWREKKRLFELRLRMSLVFIGFVEDSFRHEKGPFLKQPQKVKPAYRRKPTGTDTQKNQSSLPSHPRQTHTGSRKDYLPRTKKQSLPGTTSKKSLKNPPTGQVGARVISRHLFESEGWVIPN